ncbi:MAG: helix-turn-helix transcriptional regulator [Clostridiales bacterium]|nr:helix-turn-helix transcriptional regulator [Clostridiales bacterium]
MELKDILIELREERHLKQADIAEILNVVPSAVSKYELGKSYPEYKSLIKLADFYQVNLDYLVGRTSIRSSFRDFEASIMAEGGPLPIDFLFQLGPEDRELVRRLLVSLSKKSEYAG